MLNSWFWHVCTLIRSSFSFCVRLFCIKWPVMSLIFKYTKCTTPGSSVGIATGYGLDGPGIESQRGEISARPDRPWGTPSLLYNGYRVFSGGKVRPGHAADHSPPSSATVMEGQSYTSTHPLGHNWAFNGNTTTFFFYRMYNTTVINLIFWYRASPPEGIPTLT